jgi:hypothetical protein
MASLIVLLRSESRIISQLSNGTVTQASTVVLGRYGPGRNGPAQALDVLRDSFTKVVAFALRVCIDHNGHGLVSGQSPSHCAFDDRSTNGHSARGCLVVIVGSPAHSRWRPFGWPPPCRAKPVTGPPPVRSPRRGASRPGHGRAVPVPSRPRNGTHHGQAQAVGSSLHQEPRDWW